MDSKYVCSALSDYLNTRGIFKNFSLEIVEFSPFGSAGSTAQGFAGKARLTNRAGIMAEAVFKVGLADDWALTLENIISNDMCEILDFCPWFTCGYGMEQLLITRYDRDQHNLFGFDTDNPFKENRDTEGVEGLYKDVLFMQQAVGDDAYNYFSNLPKNSDDSIHKIFSAAMQLYSGLEIAQVAKGFSHNDLHLGNWMIVPLASAKDLVLTKSVKVAEPGSETWRLTPTFGIIPVVIDYGFSYTTACDSQPWYGSPDYFTRDVAGNYALGANQISDLFKSIYGLGGMVEQFTATSAKATAQQAALITARNGVVNHGIVDGHFSDNATPTVCIVDMITNAAIVTPELQEVSVPHEIDLIKILVPYPTGISVPNVPFPAIDVGIVSGAFYSLLELSNSNRNVATNIYKHFFKACLEANPREYITDVLTKIGGATQISAIMEGLPRFCQSAQNVAVWVNAELQPLINQKRDYYTRMQTESPGEIQTVSRLLDALQGLVDIPDGIERITVFDSVYKVAKTFTVSPTELSALQASQNPIDDAVRLYNAALAANATMPCGYDNSDLLRSAVAASPSCGVNFSGKIGCKFSYSDSP